MLFVESRVNVRVFVSRVLRTKRKLARDKCTVESLVNKLVVLHNVKYVGICCCSHFCCTYLRFGEDLVFFI